ncbi:thiamine phosphate synthase [Hyphococcus flavus]|uniref:Thiamine-phosphate synthase n=1 Tax=Hyphococcus flavus TaxID=1866326 RepID=A0AAE9ZKQ4_9PROT|nr:thiamine phosphate synthase [Hyphococcus flavus]WDI32400.1 thiamine phosphate synthase [Hyphococcus flavus]
MRQDCRLYLISPPRIDDLSSFRGAFADALSGGDVACMQLRMKTSEGPASDDDVLYAAEALLPLAREHDVEFLINDRPDLAIKCGADGVHVGQSDASCKKARTLLGDDATIGVTCHNSRHLALVAGEDGADYVAFGAFFPTTTKEAPTKADPALIEWWSFATTVQCVAIGGVTPQNCGPLVRAGADFLAVSSAVWACRDGPASAVKAFEKAIKEA